MLKLKRDCAAGNTAAQTLIVQEFETLPLESQVLVLTPFFAENLQWQKAATYDNIRKIVRATVKAGFDQLATDLGTIAYSHALTVLVLSAYSLLPGLAGLIYRRNFWTWFLVSFLLLAAINASGLGKLPALIEAESKTMLDANSLLPDEAKRMQAQGREKVSLTRWPVYSAALNALRTMPPPDRKLANQVQTLGAV